MKVKKTNNGTVHCIAVCGDCQWRDENYLTAQKNARTHVAKTGHTVSVDVGSNYRLQQVEEKG